MRAVSWSCVGICGPLATVTGNKAQHKHPWPPTVRVILDAKRMYSGSDPAVVTPLTCSAYTVSPSATRMANAFPGTHPIEQEEPANKLVVLLISQHVIDIGASVGARAVGRAHQTKAGQHGTATERLTCS